jgi:tetratricopeptide (TPR) repeat protein
MDMRNFLGVLFVLATFGYCNANEDDVIRARDLCYLQNYQAAAEGVNRLICRDESDPAGLFWQACLLQMLIYDSGNVGLLDSFYRTTDRVVALCRRRLKGSPDDARALVYWGLAELNRANCLSWQNRKLPAFMTMLKVPSRLHRALELEPGLADAAFGLGVIEYFKATADRYLFGLGLIGSRERAYSLVQKAERTGVLMVPMAQFLLGFMMKEDKLYPGAIEWCEKLLARYPDNRAARRLLRDVYLDMGRFHQAIAVARGLERDIRRAFPNNRYGLAENWLKMAYAFEKLNEADSVVVYSERIIAWEGFQNQVPWLANYVREAKGLKERVRRSKS